MPLGVLVYVSSCPHFFGIVSYVRQSSTLTAIFGCLFHFLLRHGQRFGKHIDPDTGYWYYENCLTGERHWDTPVRGVLPVQPKALQAEEIVAGDM